MRISKSEVNRRKQAILGFFRKNPTISIAKMNAALTQGEITGKSEKMLNIATGYALRKEAYATPELPLKTCIYCANYYAAFWDGVDNGPTPPVRVHALPDGSYSCCTQPPAWPTILPYPDIHIAVSPEAIDEILATYPLPTTKE